MNGHPAPTASSAAESTKEPEARLEFVIDQGAPPGNLVDALAELLLDIDEREEAEKAAAEGKPSSNQSNGKPTA